MRRLVGFALVLAVLFYGADRLARWTAERAVARSIQTSQHLVARPDVSVAGFLFLTQAVRGRYGRLDVALRNLPVEDGVTIARLDVRLNGVRVPLADVLNQRVTGAPVDSATAVALVSYAALDAATATRLPKALKVGFGPAAGNQLSVRGTFTSRLITTSVNTQAKIVVYRGDLSVGVVPTSLNRLPAAVRSQVVAALAKVYQLPALPFGFQAKEVSVGPSGVRLTTSSGALQLGSLTPTT